MDYKTIGKALQIERDTVHIDESVLNEYGITPPSEPSREDGVMLFNKIAEANNLKPLNDPLGYMALDNNAYTYLQDAYKEKYEEAAGKIDSGLMRGGSYNMRAVLSNRPKVVQKDIRAVLPKGMKYSECRFIEATPEIKTAIDDFVDTRVQITHAYGIKRSIEADTFERLQRTLSEKGKVLSDHPTGNVEKKTVLSTATLLQNSKNNKAGLEVFAKELKEPSTIDKSEKDDHATAQFSTKDKTVARFLLSNKTYLSDFGFNVEKKSGQIITTWQSEHVDTLYAEREQEVEQEISLDLSGIEESQAL